MVSGNSVIIELNIATATVHQKSLALAGNLGVGFKRANMALGTDCTRHCHCKGAVVRSNFERYIAAYE